MRENSIPCDLLIYLGRYIRNGWNRYDHNGMFEFNPETFLPQHELHLVPQFLCLGQVLELGLDGVLQLAHVFFADLQFGFRSRLCVDCHCVSGGIPKVAPHGLLDLLLAQRDFLREIGDR